MILDYWRRRLRSLREKGTARSGTVGRVLENAVWLLAGKGVGAVLSLVYLGLATRTLGPEGFGQFALILGTAQAITAFVSFQTWQIVVRYGMEHLHAGRDDPIGRLIAFSATLDVGAALVGCLIAWISVMLLGPHFGWSADLRLEALLFCFVMLLSVRSTPVGVLRLYDRFGVGATADAVTPVVRFIGALVAIALGASVFGFLCAWAAAEIATASVYWWFTARVAKGTLRRRHWRRVRDVAGDNPGIGRFAATTNLSTTLGAVGKQFGTVLVGIVAGPVAAGSYRLAYQLGQALAKVAEMLSRAMFAELTRVNFGSSQANLGPLLRDATRLAMLASLAIIALLLLAGEPFLALVAGPGYADAYPLLLLLGVAAALDLASVGFEPALIATDRATLALKLRFASTALLILLAILLLPEIGATGAAIATLAASAASLILFGIAARRAVRSQTADSAPSG